jgi:hypothetical protein
MATESAVRAAVADHNERVAQARRTPHDGPPVVVKELDVEDVVATWHARRDDR